MNELNWILIMILFLLVFVVVMSGCIKKETVWGIDIERGITKEERIKFPWD